MDKNDIFYTDGESEQRTTPFVKKYLIGITTVAVVLVIAMTLVGIFIGYSIAENKSHSIIETNPTVNINGTASTIVGVQDVTRQVEDSVVQITAISGTTASRGSGVIITRDGYIITNAHVVGNAQPTAGNIKVALANGNEYPARSCKSDVVMDIAVIKIDAGEELKPAIMGDSASLVKGQPVVIIGNPLGTLGGSVTNGVLSSTARDIIVNNRPMRLLQTNAEINPGNSGGGMFDMNGTLIGIVNAKSSATDVEGIGFAIPIDIAKDIAMDLIEVGYVKGRIDTGIQPVNILNQIEMLLTFHDVLCNGEPGVYVYNVDKRFAKDIMVGDKICAINDKAVNDLAKYNIALEQFKVGDKVKYTLKRGEDLFDVTITLEEYRG